MTITCAIIDDEPLAAGLLESYARKTPFLELRGTYHNAIPAMKDLREEPVQLLFLDIQMPELSGIELAKILPKYTKIIFTTAFSQYAIEGYKVNAIDYLLKPISYQDFVSSTNKVLEYYESLSRQETYARDRFMYVKSEYKLVRIMLDDILYVEGLKDYIRIFLKSGERIMSLLSMKKLEETLPQPEFLRIHRSYIVHMTEVRSIDRFRIVFGDEFLPISDNYKQSVQQYLDAHTLV
ncbi:MAG: LytTR family DNA-binding domain-containing protein [Prevotella sp.]|nr:LytTR family DNA-binding domain-containing protein [Prevotella sp.]